MQKYVKYTTFTDKFILFDEKDLEKKIFLVSLQPY